MAENKIGPGTGNRGKGRPKGSRNKTTRAAKEAIAFAAEELGGGERLAEWCKESPENEGAFWKVIYPKLLPLDVNAQGNLTIKLPDDVQSI